MLDRIRELQKEIEHITANSIEEAEGLRIKYLSKKGEISKLFEEFRNVAAEQKREIGQAVNTLKELALGKINMLKVSLQEQDNESSGIDLTLPAESMKLGTRHPISIVKNEMLEIFKRLGFVVSEGPEIEDDWHVFGALNFPEEHPARDMQDTFFIQRDPDILLRTHTSSVQVHDMETMKPPIRTVTFGRVFRNEAISYRAHCMFHQIEGLYVDENVSFADLKQTLIYFTKELFGETAEIRMRPSYFPFTEPSAEVDVSCSICGGKGCNVCKYTGWLEILGCGMVDPHVFDNLNIDSQKYTGFAFGMGIERIAMLKFGINDLRLYFENDVRFLQQFQSAW
jgi:phenylalanyl-tRNA synthetase alpha chain